MNFNILDKTILLGLTGSRAYGTNNSDSDSDYDYKGIFISPIKYYLGINNTFEQWEGKITNNWLHNYPENNEVVVYDIRKFCRLASLANPNILELLYLDCKNHCNYTINKTFSDPLFNIRDSFISKKVRYTYAGYAHAQLKRIRSHRQWLIDPPKGQPTRKQFDLPESSLIASEQLKTAISMVDKQIEEWSTNPDEEVPVTVLSKARDSIIEMVAYILDNKSNPEKAIILAAGKKLGFDDNFLEILAREKAYKSAMNNWKSYQNWELNRNPKRHELELKYGFDCKHAMHLVRLLRTCIELLSDKSLQVYREDREELVSIRNGAWSYDQIEQYAEDMDNKAAQLYLTSKLPNKPDMDLIDKTLVNIIQRNNEL